MAITLVVEDGTGLSTANTYISAADADVYNANLGRAEWDELEADEKAAALVKATQYIDTTFNWLGLKGSRAQALQWPRHLGIGTDGEPLPIVDRDGYDIEGVPIEVIKATAEAAFLSLENDLFQIADPNGKIIRDKTDVLETQYQEETASSKPAEATIFQALNLMLRGLYARPTSGATVGKAFRG